MSERLLTRLNLVLTVALVVSMVVVWLWDPEVGWSAWQRRFTEQTADGATARTIEVRTIRPVGLARVDRCPSCHVGLTTQQQAPMAHPLAPHPAVPGAHRPSRFGCTICHEGRGRSLDAGRAHLGRRTGTLVRAACARCHTIGIEGTDVLVRGAELYLQHGCFYCHQSRGFGGEWGSGPTLEAAGRLPVQKLRQAITEPEKTAGMMPAFAERLSDPADLEALLAYVAGMRADEPIPAPLRGADALRPARCETCHAGRPTERTAGRSPEHRCRLVTQNADEVRCSRCHEGGPTRPDAHCPYLDGLWIRCAACHPDPPPGSPEETR